MKSTIRVRNASKDWIAGFTVTEHWYDKQGNAVGSGSRAHRERFMRGEVLELELKTRKGPNFFQNQFLRAARCMEVISGSSVLASG